MSAYRTFSPFTRPQGWWVVLASLFCGCSAEAANLLRRPERNVSPDAAANTSSNSTSQQNSTEANTTANSTGDLNATEVNASAKNLSKIPPHLVLTAKQSSLDQMPDVIQRNINRTLNLSRELRIRWFGDHDCLEYIKKHYDDELATIFANEVRGMFRGDLCRAAVLAKEGGFYMDVDLQMKEPLTSLISKNTTFMSAIAADGTIILNAIMASAPGDPIMNRSIEIMREMYRSGGPSGLLGAEATQLALHGYEQEHCKNETTPNPAFDHRCGSEAIRMIRELEFSCWGEQASSSELCPEKRAISSFFFHGAEYGLFVEEMKLVGWSRMEECESFGCGGGGNEISDHLQE